MDKVRALEVLGLQNSAGKEEMKFAYRRLARKYHPDSNLNNPVAKQKFQEIAEAYAVLTGEKKKNAFDFSREDILDNEFAFDNYVAFFKKCQEEAKSMNFTLNEKYFFHADNKKRGKYTSGFYQILQESLKTSLEVHRNSCLFYDTFMEQLNKELAKKGDSAYIANNFIEKLKGKRGIISDIEISKEKHLFETECANIRLNKLAFNNFQAFYDTMERKMRERYGVKIELKDKCPEYFDTKNIGSIPADVFRNLAKQINDSDEKFEKKKNSLFLQLNDYFLKRNVDATSYLAYHTCKNNEDKFNYDTVTIPKLVRLLETFDFMDGIEFYLPPEYSLESYLGQYGKRKETVKKAELVEMVNRLKANAMKYANKEVDNMPESFGR